MSFVSEFNRLPLSSLLKQMETANVAEVARVLASGANTLADFAVLLSPAADEMLEQLCRKSQALTRQRFGRVIRLYAPLYLSNECINNCAYCGFSRDNPILRVTLSVDQVEQEAKALAAQGFRNILLVAGEHPKFVSSGYMAECVSRLARFIPSISLEVGPMETPEYEPLVAAGADGLIVYQETYDRGVYAEMHTLGPKRNFDWRAETPERAYAAGFRRLGIAALYGLADWRYEALCTAAHAQYLLRECWKAQLTVSFPRLRPCAGDFQPKTLLSDRQLVQLMTAFRLLLPDAGLVLSTRENAEFRNGLFPLGVTHASAGSHTEPGGYTGAGRDSLHQTVRGRMVPVADSTPIPALTAKRATEATGQFDIADDRSPAEVSAAIRKLGYEPVWKDWDAAITAPQ
ncbi:MAG TPA: 2-iminoacetate synthase ThiH [Candidatus Limnocylindria bacterium]|nr:2-iminoacetate synthase ThiH [Candidatus Limnocylindria bacterium]